MRSLRVRVGLVLAVCLALAIVVWAQVDTPTQVAFTCSADQATLTGYQVRSVVVATQVASSPVSVGLPTPVGGVCTVNISTAAWGAGIAYRVEVRSVRGSAVSAWVATARTGVVGEEPPPPAATTYYVSTTGLDSRSCVTAQNIATPKQTLNSAVTCLAAGSTLYVRGGTYAESLINRVPSGSSWGAKVRIAAYSGETVWMHPASGARVINFNQNQQYIEFDGINLDGTNIINDIVKIEVTATTAAHHIRMQNAEIKGATGTSSSPVRQHVLLTGVSTNRIGFNEFINMTLHGHGRVDFDHGFYIQSNDNLFDGCVLYGIWGAGFHIYDIEQPYSARNVVRNSIVRDGGQNADTTEKGWGIVAFGNDHLFYNNVIYNVRNTGSGPSAAIRIGSGTGVRVYNNTLVGNRCYGIVVRSTSSGGIIRNNISYGNLQGNYYVEPGGSVATLTNNLTGATDPLFVNLSGHDYHLQSGSGARNTGATIAAVPTDFDGVARPQEGTYDMGAYEYVP